MQVTTELTLEAFYTRGLNHYLNVKLTMKRSLHH